MNRLSATASDLFGKYNPCLIECTERKEAELEMVQRHLREGERIVAHQRALEARLGTSGLRTGEVEILLDSFQDAQRLHEDRLARIQGRQAQRFT